MSFDSKEAFPPYSLVTASSEAALSGCDEPGSKERSGLCEQSIPVGSSELTIISVLLTNESAKPVEITACVFANGFNAQTKTDRRILNETQALVPSGKRQWIDFHVVLSPLAGARIGHYIRFQLDLPEGVSWIETAVPDPAFPADGSSSNPPATLYFRLSPPQPCFWPSNVLPETDSTNRFTGIWKSDPDQDFPQLLEISWKDPLQLHGLEFEFADSDECPVHYTLEISAQTESPHFIEIEKNERHCRTHSFPTVLNADFIRLTFHATRGSRSVSVKSIRPILK